MKRNDCVPACLCPLHQAYSVYDEEIGYCQGQSFLAAVLLLHVSTTHQQQKNPLLFKQFQELRGNVLRLFDIGIFLTFCNVKGLALVYPE